MGLITLMSNSPTIPPIYICEIRIMTALPVLTNFLKCPILRGLQSYRRVTEVPIFNYFPFIVPRVGGGPVVLCARRAPTMPPE